MQNIAGRCQQTFESKKFVDITQQCFALLPQVNSPASNLNFHWRWWDRIQAIFLNLFYFILNKICTKHGNQISNQMLLLLFNWQNYWYTQLWTYLQIYNSLNCWNKWCNHCSISQNKIKHETQLPKNNQSQTSEMNSNQIKNISK